jgi:hypothetical protein
MTRINLFAIGEKIAPLALGRCGAGEFYNVELATHNQSRRRGQGPPPHRRRTCLRTKGTAPASPPR